jgi:hypothetical protein
MATNFHSTTLQTERAVDLCEALTARLSEALIEVRRLEWSQQEVALLSAGKK